jgi:hypothetical protein
MSPSSRQRLGTHAIRAAAAIVISIVALLGVMTILRFAPVMERFSWYGVALAIAAGYVPLWRWYRRDAYPIGLVFCPLMFFILRQVYAWASPWFWPDR